MTVDRKTYMRELMRKKRANKSVNTTANAVSTKAVSKPDPVSKSVSIWRPEINLKTFEGHGRMSPVNGYVMVSKRSEPNGDTVNGVVSEDTWHARLDKVCAHGLAGWSCKQCLPV